MGVSPLIKPSETKTTSNDARYQQANACRSPDGRAGTNSTRRPALSSLPSNLFDWLTECPAVDVHVGINNA